MIVITLSTADKALKDVYLDVVSEQLNVNINPLLARIKQTTTDVWGKEIVKVAPYGINGGIGAGTETGSLPIAGGNNYAQFRQELKNLYGRIEISDKAIRASENSAGAFVNLLNAEMEGLIRASSFNFGRMLYGNGSGLLSKVEDNEASANGVTTLKVASAKNLAEGMIVDIVDASGAAFGSGSSAILAKSILSVNRTDNTVKILVSGLEANQFLPIEVDAVNGKAEKQYYLCIQGSYGKEITGIDAIFNSDVTHLYGLKKSDYGWLKPKSVDSGTESGTGNISEIVMQSVIDMLEEESDSRVDFIVCSAGVKRNYQSYLANYRSNIDVLDLAGGYKALSYNGIPVVSDRFAPANTMFLLNTSEFNLHQLCDWKWLEGEDGRVIKQIQGTPTYSATLVKYADLICNKPCGQGVITNISES